MNYSINSTKEYHRSEMKTLGWELTVCNALQPEGSPVRKILRCDASYGKLLASYLRRFIPMEKVKKVIEIGGGCGFLMKDLLEENNFGKITMLDVSPVLLQQQREILQGDCVEFREEDFLEASPSLLEKTDLAVLNEMLGDLPTATGLGPEIFDKAQETLEELPSRVRDLFNLYTLERPESFPFNLNLGALEAVEKLCTSEIPFIFLSEHSCEASVPDAYRPYIHVSSPGNPERIRLRGHDEYTIQFSHLEAVARAFGYISVRGPLADIVAFDFSDRVRCILSSRSVEKDEYEIIHHFVEDLYQYEYLLLIKNSSGNTSIAECRRCGKCCLADFIAYVTQISSEDQERWRREGRQDILSVIQKEHAVWVGDHFISSDDGRYIHGCPFLAWEGDHATCTIYETRPEICRRYKPASSEICSQYRSS
jgi:Fe-S-cluster containining protein